MADQKVKGRVSQIVNGQSVQKNMFSTLVDIVFVIDATGSMGNLINEVKARALSMHEDIINGLRDKKRKVTKMRIKVVVFRDIYVDPVPFEVSEFFTLPEESDEFRSFVENIRATGGGDEPENSIEALYMAMQSDFQMLEQGQKGRQIVVMLTDASAHRLDHPQRASHSRYPQGMPADLEGVHAMWEDMDFRAKRMVVFAPNVWPWTEIAMWNSVYYEPSAAGSGIDKDTFDSVIQSIESSV